MTKSTITIEQLLEIIETDHVQCGEASYLARMALAAMASESGCLPLDYLQGHKDGLEWAARLAEANHPETGDWLYDDPIELAKAIRKGPDMPPAQPAADSEPVAFIARYESGAIHGTCDRDDPVKMEWLKRGMDVSPLYAAPQLPQPAVVSEKIIDNFEEEFRRAFEVSAAVEQLIEIGYQGDKFSLSIRDAATLWKLGRAAMLQGGNSPVIPDGWQVEAEKLAEMHGMSFVLFRHGEAPQCADPTKVVISFTDKGLGHDTLPAAHQEVK